MFMVKPSLNILMVIFMKGNLKIIELKVMDYINIPTEIPMKVILKIT